MTWCKSLMVRAGLLLLLATATGILYAAEGDTYTLLDDSNLRKGPDSSYASTGVVREGEQAVKLETQGHWVKVRIDASGDVGWLYADSLEQKIDTQPEVTAQAQKVTAIENKTMPKAESVNKAAPDIEAASGVANVASQHVVEAAALDQQMAESAPISETVPEPVVVDTTEVHVPEVVATQESQVKPMAPLFADGAVSQKSESVEQTVAVAMQPEVAVSQPEVTAQAQKVAAIENKVTPKAEPANKAVSDVEAGSGVADVTSQHVVEAAALDQQMPEIAPVPASEPISKTVPEQVVIKSASAPASPPVEQTVAVAMQPEVAVSQPEVAAQAQKVTSDSGMKQVTETTTIRSGPGSSNGVLGWVGKGAHVQAVGRQGDWLKVRIPDGGRTGWIETGMLQSLDATTHADTVMADTAVSTGSAEPESGLQQPVVDSMQLVDAGQGTSSSARAVSTVSVSFIKIANLRAGPDNSYDVVAWAGKGAYAREIARKGDWVRVQMQQSGRIGWAYKSLVKRTDTGGILPVATVLSDQVTEAPVTPSSSTVSPPVNKAAMVMVDPLATEKHRQIGGSRAKLPSVSPVQPAVIPVKPAMVQKSSAGMREPVHGAAVNSLFSFNRKANLRAGPDVKYDVVSWAGVGSYAYELDRKGDWVRVRMQVSKRIGWVYHRSLKLVKAGMPLPVAVAKTAQVAVHPVMQAPHVMAKTALEGLYVFRQTGNLRVGPGKQYDVVAWGGKHETASIIDKKGDWRRIRMTMSGKVGWVFNTLLANIDSDHVVSTKPVPAVVEKNRPGVKMYQVLRTEPLRADAIQYSELNGWISKDESVAVIEQRDGWMRVQPQDTNKQAGWVKADYLKHTAEMQEHAKIKKELRTVEYQDRISKGEAFNFSYAALETALYRVPVEDIHVRIDRDDLKALFRKGIYDKSSFDIKVKSGRHHLAGKIKVLGSSTRIFKKKSLLIKLDKESSRWYGRRRIALRSMASDKALMREWMAWKLLAVLGMKVPEVHFTRVSFNHGEKTGLYLNIEWMGKQFLADNDLEVNGGFYQPNDASHCGDLNSSENMDLCFDKITPQDEDYSMLSTMAQAVSTASAADMDSVLAKYFNEESVINWIAVNTLVTNGDTYNKNYWLHYSPASKKWTLLPWDYNLTFGRVYDPYGVKPFKIFNDNFQYYFPPDVGASNPLKDKLLRNPKLRTRLETILKHLLGLEPNGPEETFGWFSPTVMQARIGNLAAVVGKEVYKDTFLTYGEGEFTKTYESLMHFVTAHDYYLKTKLQGPYRWQPSPPFDPSQPAVLEPLPKILYGEGTIESGGQSVHITDHGWGYFVARLNLDEPVKQKTQFKVRVEGGATPKYLPVGQAPKRCIRRSWVVSTETPGITANGNLMLEYTQQNLKRTEVPVTLHEELLELWMRDGSHWRPLKTEVNEYANTLIARGVHLESGHIQRFVACSPF